MPWSSDGWWRTDWQGGWQGGWEREKWDEADSKRHRSRGQQSPTVYTSPGPPGVWQSQSVGLCRATAVAGASTTAAVAGADANAAVAGGSAATAVAGASTTTAVAGAGARVYQDYEIFNLNLFQTWQTWTNTWKQHNVALKLFRDKAEKDGVDHVLFDNKKP